MPIPQCVQMYWWVWFWWLQYSFHGARSFTRAHQQRKREEVFPYFIMFSGIIYHTSQNFLVSDLFCYVHMSINIYVILLTPSVSSLKFWFLLKYGKCEQSPRHVSGIVTNQVVQFRSNHRVITVLICGNLFISYLASQSSKVYNPLAWLQNSLAQGFRTQLSLHNCFSLHLSFDKVWFL